MSNSDPWQEQPADSSTTWLCNHILRSVGVPGHLFSFCLFTSFLLLLLLLTLCPLLIISPPFPLSPSLHRACVDVY